MVDAAPAPKTGGGSFKDKDKPVEVRLSNIIAAKGTLSLLLCRHCKADRVSALSAILSCSPATREDGQKLRIT